MVYLGGYDSVSYEDTIKKWYQADNFKTQLWDDSLPSSLMWPVAILRRYVSKFTHVGFSTGFSHDMAAGFPEHKEHKRE